MGRSRDLSLDTAGLEHRGGDATGECPLVLDAAVLRTEGDLETGGRNACDSTDFGVDGDWGKGQVVEGCHL